MKQLATRIMALGLVVGGVAAFQGSAFALPNSQGVCAFSTQVISSTDGARPLPGLTLTVTNNATSNRNAIVQVSADTGVDDQAEVRISYALDNGPPREDTYGPANFANVAQYYEGRMVLAIIPVPPGTHTIKPYWRVSGSPGKTAVIDSRCATVEITTK
jgi:hypothetical protein